MNTRMLSAVAAGAVVLATAGAAVAGGNLAPGTRSAGPARAAAAPRSAYAPGSHIASPGTQMTASGVPVVVATSTPSATPTDMSTPASSRPDTSGPAAAAKTTPTTTSPSTLPTATPSDDGGPTKVAGGISWEGQPSTPGEGLRLDPGQSITNAHGFSVLTMQPDGNLVTTVEGLTRWQSDTHVPGSYLRGNPNTGDVEIVTATKPAQRLWSAGIGDQKVRAPGVLVMPSGQVVAYNGDHTADLGGLGPASAGYYPFWDAPCSRFSSPGVCASYYLYRYPGTRTDPYELPFRICASYLGWWVDSHGGDTSQFAAEDWGVTFARYMNTTPTVGSAAYFPPGSSIQVGTHSFYVAPPGHVGLVTRVYSDGTVDISQYNADGVGEYSMWTHMRAPKYIHFPGVI